MNASKALENFCQHLRGKVEMAKETLAEFTKRLEGDADNAFRWGGNAMRAAAVQRVAGQILGDLERPHIASKTDMEKLQLVRGFLLQEALQAARDPERSTSGISNLQTQERGMVHAGLLQDIDSFIANIKE
jgi:hypothetical protein